MHDLNQMPVDQRRLNDRTGVVRIWCRINLRVTEGTRQYYGVAIGW